MFVQFYDIFHRSAAVQKEGRLREAPITKALEIILSPMYVLAFVSVVKKRQILGLAFSSNAANVGVGRMLFKSCYKYQTLSR